MAFKHSSAFLIKYTAVLFKISLLEPTYTHLIGWQNFEVTMRCFLPCDYNLEKILRVKLLKAPLFEIFATIKLGALLSTHPWKIPYY